MQTTDIIKTKRHEVKGEGMKTFEVSFWKDGKVIMQEIVSSYSFAGALIEAEGKLLYLPNGNYDSVSIVMKD